DVLLRCSDILEPEPEEGGERCQNRVDVLAEKRTQPRSGLRPERDLGLADLGSEPAEEDLDERPRREAAVRVASPFEPGDGVRRLEGELRQEPRLADPRGAREEDDTAAAGRQVPEDVP